MNHTRLRILELDGTETFDTGADEVIVLPLAGSCMATIDGETFELEGRESVFSAVTDFAYAPRDARVEIAGAGRFALPAAVASRRLPARYGAAEDVSVELRGAGNASRQVNNFCSVDAFEADALPEAEPLAVAVELLRGARRPLIVAGGGTIYAGATDALAAFAEATGIPVAETQAGKGSLPFDHPQCAGAIGATGTTDANALAREADVVLGVGTRWSDFTTASRSLFGVGTAFVNLNVAPVDAFKHAGLPLVADARAGLEALREALDGVTFDTPAFAWDAVVERAYALGHAPLPAQSEVIGVVNRLSGPRDVVVCAAGSMPGDLHKLWRTRDPKGYHVEYGYSCMGYEIAGGLGVKLAAPDREVFVLVGDGSYLMMASEIVTAVQEDIKLVIVLVQNHGYASIGALSETVGSQRFGTRYRYRDTDETLPVNLLRNAAGLGARVLDAATIEDFETALRTAVASDKTTVVQVHTDPLVPAPSSEAWWDVPVAEVAELESTRDARAAYERQKATQQTYLRTPETVRTP